MSFCDNCIHDQVCRYIKDVKKTESAPIDYLSGYTNGPTVKHTFDCPYKLVGYTAEDDSWALKVQNLEFPEYQQIVVPGQNNFKAYYNWKAVNRDHKNRYFL